MIHALPTGNQYVPAEQLGFYVDKIWAETADNGAVAIFATLERLNVPAEFDLA